MDAADSSPSTAVRTARDDEWRGGVRFSTLEGQQGQNIQPLRAHRTAAMWTGLAVFLSMLAPFAGLLAPVGGTGFGWTTESDGLTGANLEGAVVVCFLVGAAGQAWMLFDWWRSGKPRSTAYRLAAAAALACSALAMWLLPRVTSPSSFSVMVAPIAVTGVLAAISLVLGLTRSKSTTMWEANRLKYGERLRALPAHDQDALLSERVQILDALRERRLIDEQRAQEALSTRLGDWWTLDPGRKSDSP